jgi:hypothetical protein
MNILGIRIGFRTDNDFQFPILHTNSARAIQPQAEMCFYIPRDATPSTSIKETPGLSDVPYDAFAETYAVDCLVAVCH